jgi:hypothetical protein
MKKVEGEEEEENKFKKKIKLLQEKIKKRLSDTYEISDKYEKNVSIFFDFQNKGKHFFFLIISKYINFFNNY